VCGRGPHGHPRRRADRHADGRPSGRLESHLTSPATPVILDTDPGLDDALALLLALGSPEIDLIGVTTVAGNTTLANTTANALRILELADRTDVPVAAGAARGLVREAPRTAEYVHGGDGLGGLPLPPPAPARSRRPPSSSSPDACWPPRTP
jgi:pyrimidine-specific ribonucleoside hydrolase